MLIREEWVKKEKLRSGQGAMDDSPAWGFLAVPRGGSASQEPKNPIFLLIPALPAAGN